MGLSFYSLQLIAYLADRNVYLDGGERLGKFITQYREAYFRPGAHNGSVVYEYKPRAGAKEAISKKMNSAGTAMTARSVAANEAYSAAVDAYTEAQEIVLAEGFEEPDLLAFVK